jgi:hypothetical protein
MKENTKLPTGPAVPRRGLLIGAGVAGATVLAASKFGATAPAAVEAATSAVGDAPSGYRLTAHVQRYYQTTKV